MNLPLRHSHIAVRASLASLAKAAGSAIADGEDDVGRYRFFDLMIGREDDAEQRIRFAAHDGDTMVHLLAERIQDTSDLAAALFNAGVRSQAELSISTDQNGLPLRDATDIHDRISALWKSSASRLQGPSTGRTPVGTVRHRAVR